MEGGGRGLSGGPSASRGKMWDLGEVVDLEGGMQLRYEGEDPLGGGSFGLIFPCKLKLGKEDTVIDAVVKCEKKDCNIKDGYEFRKLRKIRPHDNIVRFYDGKVLELGDSALYGAVLVIEKMDCNLKQLISNYRKSSEKCTLGEVISILQQIVQGLIHLQDNGFMHMDVKLQNILVSRGSAGKILVKITDFGESKELDPGKHSVRVTFRGTQVNMAPELLFAARTQGCSHRITAHVDVYSVGMLMCTLFDAKAPQFISQHPNFVIQEIEVGDFLEKTASCRAPKELCDLIEKCLLFDLQKAEDSRGHGRPSLEELLSDLGVIKEIYSSDRIEGTMVHTDPNDSTWDLGERADSEEEEIHSVGRIHIKLSRMWDLDKRVDLELGMQLIYEGEGALGQGSYGVVFPCKLKLGKDQGHRVIDAVVKCVKLDCNYTDGYEIHKVREIPPHDNLVKFYDGKVLEPGESEYFDALFVMERMDCNLKQLFFEDSPFAEPCTYGDVVNILVQIVHGLKHLHSSGFLHMDVKPQNILISKSPEGNLLVKIGGIGKPKRLQGSTSFLTMHRELYEAPEVIFAPRFKDTHSKMTAQADVYSLGVLMLAILNKQDPPFTSQARGFVGREILVGDIYPCKVFCRAPPELCDLIEKCLRFEISNMKDPRFHGRPSLEEILEALKRIEECGWMNQTIQTEVCAPSGLQVGFP